MYYRQALLRQIARIAHPAAAITHVKKSEYSRMVSLGYSKVFIYSLQLHCKDLFIRFCGTVGSCSDLMGTLYQCKNHCHLNYFFPALNSHMLRSSAFSVLAGTKPTLAPSPLFCRRGQNARRKVLNSCKQLCISPDVAAVSTYVTQSTMQAGKASLRNAEYFTVLGAAVYTVDTSNSEGLGGCCMVCRASRN